MGHIYITETGRKAAQRAKNSLAAYFEHVLPDDRMIDRADREGIGEILDDLMEAVIAEVRGTLIPRDLGERLRTLEDRVEG